MKKAVTFTPEQIEKMKHFAFLYGVRGRGIPVFNREPTKKQIKDLKKRMSTAYDQMIKGLK